MKKVRAESAPPALIGLMITPLLSYPKSRDAIASKNLEMYMDPHTGHALMQLYKEKSKKL